MASPIAANMKGANDLNSLRNVILALSLSLTSAGLGSANIERLPSARGPYSAAYAAR